MPSGQQMKNYNASSHFHDSVSCLSRQKNDLLRLILTQQTLVFVRQATKTWLQQFPKISFFFSIFSHNFYSSYGKIFPDLVERGSLIVWSRPMLGSQLRFSLETRSPPLDRSSVENMRATVCLSFQRPACNWKRKRTQKNRRNKILFSPVFRCYVGISSVGVYYFFAHLLDFLEIANRLKPHECVAGGPTKWWQSSGHLFMSRGSKTVLHKDE